MTFEYVILCHDPNGVPMVYGVFGSRGEANDWLAETAEEAIRMGTPPCDNDHDTVFLERVTK